MTLLDNMKLLMPQTPDPPISEMKSISEALELAITTNIRISFVPGIGQVFIANLKSPNPFLLALGAYLDVAITPIISAALASQPSVGGPIPAWLSVQPSFDAISPLFPPFMVGVLGAIFWQAIVLTIRLAILPPPSTASQGSGADSAGRVEILNVDN